MNRQSEIVLVSALGEIIIALDTAAAPLTAANFIELVEAGAYDGGVFHRSVRSDNGSNTEMDPSVVGKGLSGEPFQFQMPDDSCLIEVVQASARDALGPRQPIPLEHTRDTGLNHLTGTISMARQTPDSAVSDFFICLRDEPELDFGGRRNPDGQGSAAFGRVIRGFDVVRRIHRSPTRGQTLEPPIVIESARLTRRD